MNKYELEEYRYGVNQVFIVIFSIMGFIFNGFCYNNFQSFSLLAAIILTLFFCIGIFIGVIIIKAFFYLLIFLFININRIIAL